MRIYATKSSLTQGQWIIVMIENITVIIDCSVRLSTVAFQGGIQDLNWNNAIKINIEFYSLVKCLPSWSRTWIISTPLSLLLDHEFKCSMRLMGVSENSGVSAEWPERYPTIRMAQIGTFSKCKWLLLTYKFLVHPVAPRMCTCHTNQMTMAVLKM